MVECVEREDRLSELGRKLIGALYIYSNGSVCCLTMNISDSTRQSELVDRVRGVDFLPICSRIKFMAMLRFLELHHSTS